MSVFVKLAIFQLLLGWSGLCRKAAEIKENDILKHYRSAGPRGGYHMRCCLTCTSKRNLQYQLKGKMENKVKAPVTNKPAKLNRTYDCSRYVICLEDN